MDALLIDPVLARACGSALAVILLLGAWQKLRDVAVFEAAVELYRLLPDRVVPLFARLFPMLEAAAGAALLFESSRGLGLLLALSVLGVSTGGVLINLLRGHTDIECGCGGADGNTRLSWALPVRNAVLMALAVAGAQAGLARPLVWVDFISVAGGTLALLGIYAAGNQLLANHPRLMQLRNGS